MDDRPSTNDMGFLAPVNEERLARFFALGRAERIARALQHQINPAEMSRWAARCPEEVPLIGNEYFFIAETLADNETPGGARVSATPPLPDPVAMRRPGAALSGSRPGARRVTRDERVPHSAGSTRAGGR